MQCNAMQPSSAMAFELTWCSQQKLQSFLEKAMEHGFVEDGAVAQDETQVRKAPRGSAANHRQ
jgi:hypothetical protein